MKEKDVRAKIGHAARELGYVPIKFRDAIKCAKCGTLYHPPAGRPDLVCLHPYSFTILIEVKALMWDERSFNMDALDEKQRKYLNWWEEDIGGRGYIGLGVIRGTERRNTLEGLYLVDWHIWKVLDAEVRTYFKEDQNPRLPYSLGEYKRRVSPLQELDIRLDIETILRPYLLERDGAKWYIPVLHSAQPYP
jgi:hypothetical protein